MSQPVLFLAGPTAVGKSSVAQILALRLKGEIISADSMQVYRGMDIGTAKPEPRARAEVRHHLIDIRDPGEPFSVHSFRSLALECLREVSSRGFLPLVAGGTGLYVRALIRGLDPRPEPSEELRGRLEAEAEASGVAALYGRLQQIDPEHAARIKPTDLRRIIRALEVNAPGAVVSTDCEAALPLSELGFSPVIVGLTCEREALYRVINRRVDQMFEDGLVGEVERLASSGMAKTALQAVGYKEILERLREGEFPPELWDEAVEAVQKATRHLAKRQMTWFRREEGLVWVERSPEDSDEAVADKVLQVFQEAA